ncbi:alpha/beta fold hydrolase [Granulicella sp. S190]|uniref:alpha/beta fold hydrolase n=1 Tax=Granulicella sp. S190 TaxID=1747226 RepID=UPI00131DB93E|nr:alpha/beta hydrolase [Granulicella sp. S190]
MLKKIRTELLEIAFEDGGSIHSPAVLLLHGWPDAPRGWEHLAARLQTEGWRTVIPYIRGSGQTRFLSEETPRVGAGVALAQDALDLADGLGIDRFAVVGHDWGARAAYTMAALFPERITTISALALAYQPGGRFHVPSFEQSRRFWYQWFQCIEGGAEKVQEDPCGFARIQWDTWSPSGWFDEAEFSRTAQSFLNPDWVPITLNSYRSRWMKGEAWDARYDDHQRKLEAIERVSIPTLMIQGADDRCDAPSQSEGKERYFMAGYRRMLLDGVGHFPHRESPDRVADAIVLHLQEKASR